MSCIGKNVPLKVIEKVAVMLFLSELPLIVTALEFFFARDDRLTGTYCVGVWSMLMIKECGMLYLSTLDTISWVNSSCASLKAPSGISNLAVVPLLRTKPIRRNKLCAQEDDSRSICPTYPGLRDINAVAVLVAIDLEITLLQLLDAMIYFWTIAWILFPIRSGSPFGSFVIRGSRIVSFCFDLVSSDCYFCRKLPTVLSFSFGNRLLNLWTAAAGPFSLPYLPIL